MVNTRIDLDKNCPIFIYGAGGNCRNIIRNSPNHLIMGVIDKRADELKEILGVEVMTKEVFFRKAPKDCVIILSIKNVFAHSEIVREFQTEGFLYYVFKPLAVLKKKKPTREQIYIDEVYETIMEKYELPSAISIPIADSEQTAFYDDTSLIVDEGEYVRAWVPEYLIFNYDYNEPYGRINMRRFPLVLLYRFLLDPATYDREYVLENFYEYNSSWVTKNNVQVTDELKKSMLSSRIGAFNEMEQTFENHNDFFIQNAPEVKYKDGRFYLVNSGRNRVAYLIAKNFKLIPVKMRSSCYKLWGNDNHREEFIRFLRNDYKRGFYATIPNPCFLGEQSVNPTYYENVCSRIADSLLDRGSNGYAGILCCLKDQGCLSRYLRTLGMEVSNVYDDRFDDEEKRFVNLADELCNQTVKDDSVKACLERGSDSFVLITDNIEMLKEFASEIRICRLIYIGDADGNSIGFEIREESDIGGYITADGNYKTITDYRVLRKTMAVFGVGDVGRQVYGICNKDYNIVAFADNNPKKIGKTICGLAVVSPNDLKIIKPDIIAIGVYKAVLSIKKQLIDMGFEEEQITVPIVPPHVFYNDSIKYDDVCSVKDGENSLSTKYFCEKRTNIQDEEFHKKLEDLKTVLSENNIPVDDVCICSGGVLQAYGLRQSKLYDDIDVIMMSKYRELYGKQLVIISETAEMHPQNEYDISDDEIIRNANNHFVYKGLKFVNADIYLRHLAKHPSEEYELLKKVII